MPKKKEDGFKIIADNRKARYAYAIDETLEAGIMLMGSEVKSLRSGKTTIGESYAHAKDGELWLVNCYIPEYTQASRFNHEPKRTRKLLVHKREAASLLAWALCTSNLRVRLGSWLKRLAWVYSGI